MGIAQPEEHVGIRFAENVGNIVGIAHDLDRSCQSGDDLGRVIVGQAAPGQPVDNADGQTGQQQDSRNDTECPAEQTLHTSPC